MQYLPNILTIIRIILIPVFSILFLTEFYFFATVIFIFSVMTDFFDGYLARKYDLTSELGQMLDPLADKLTIISILFILVVLGIIPEIVALILLFREIFILFGGVLAYSMGLDIIKPSRLGKIAIFLLYTAISLKILKVNYIDYFLFFVVVPINIVSGIDYFTRFIRKNKQAEQ